MIVHKFFHKDLITEVTEAKSENVSSSVLPGCNVRIQQQDE